MTVAEYIRKIQTYEEYAFSWEELLSNCDKTQISIKRELSRLVEKKEVINLRKGFYLIIPPRYSKQMVLPIHLYIHKLFKYLNRPYYLGFYSASKFYGASHQQIQKDYVVTSPPSLATINRNRITIDFLTASRLPKKNILQKKSDAGIFNISSPALTAIDLIHYQTKLGGLNRIFTVLEELAEEIEPGDIEELLTWYPYNSALQRLGFILEKIQADSQLLTPIVAYLQKTKFYPVLLSQNTTDKPGSVNNYWKIDVNIKLESDL